MLSPPRTTCLVFGCVWRNIALHFWKYYGQINDMEHAIWGVGSPVAAGGAPPFRPSVLSAAHAQYIIDYIVSIVYVW